MLTTQLLFGTHPRVLNHLSVNRGIVRIDKVALVNDDVVNVYATTNLIYISVGCPTVGDNAAPR